MKKSKVFLPIFSFGILLVFALILILPESREVFKTLSTTHPYIMAFIKFAFLATIGEIFAMSLAKKSWSMPVKIIARFVIWGLIGIWITYMMKIFSGGVASLMKSGALPGGNNTFLRALYISATMNLTFGPTFMAVHKCSDKLLELMAKKSDDLSMKNVVSSIDWTTFVGFTLFKTVPIFWIPAHTVTFMLPAEYQVIMAAALSIALGVILSLKK